MQTVFLFGPLAQLGERQVRNLEVRGSIPLWSTKEAPHRLGGGVLVWLAGGWFGERTPPPVAEANGRLAMIALRRCVNPPIPGGMNVRSEHFKNSLTCRRTFRFRSPYGPPYEEHNIDILRKNRVFTRFFAPFWHFGTVTKKSRNADIFRILVGRELMSSNF